MTSRFDVTYPPKDEITFDGGSNFKYARALIADNESAENLNVISSGDAVMTRPGVTKVNSTSVGTFACDGLLTRNDITGVQTMVCWFGGSMYTLSNTTLVTVPSAQSVWTAGSRVYGAEYENHLFMGNGGSIPMKWNGSNFTRMGVYPPVSAPTYSTIGASGTSAISNGTYYYKVTYLNSSSVEGNPSSASVAISAACQTVTLDVPVAATSFGVSARRIYRASGPSATYQRIAEIADNTTATYADNFDQTVGVAPPTDNGVPPLFNAVAYHQDRIFCNDPSQPNYLWYSELGEPYTFGALNFIKVGDATSDLLRAIGVQDNALALFCDLSSYLIYMPDQNEANWSPPIKTRSAFGSKAPGGVFRYFNRLAFPALENHQFRGFGAIEGSQPAPSQTLLTTGSITADLITDKIEDDMLLVPETRVPYISAVVFEGKAYISLSYGLNQSTNNRIYIFDFVRENRNRDDKAVESWWPWSYSALSPGPLTVYSNAVYFGSDAATGFIYKITDGTYTDDGSAIDSYYATKEFSGPPEDINYTKDFRRFDFLFARTGSFNMGVGYRVDSSAGIFETQPVSVAPGGSLYGTAIYGADVYSAGYQEGEQTIFIPSSRGKRIQFKFSNQNIASQFFKIIRMRFHYNRKGRR